MKQIVLGLMIVILAGLTSCQQVVGLFSGPANQAMDVLPAKKLYVPVVVRQNPPLFSTSYYLLTVNGQTLYNMGCQIGKIDRDLPGSWDTLVILDFGSPKKVGSEYGADLFWMGPVGISQISAAVENFGKGYYDCVADDRLSRIYLGIGTTNYHTSISNISDFYAHGAAWAKMVNDVNAWFADPGHNYSSQVTAVGANDIELAWNTPTITKAWVNGYDSTNLYDFYDYGSLDGCATYSFPNYNLCGNGWTREDAWYVTYGTKPAWPLPLIYATNGVHAEQWALLSLYSYNTRGYPFIFMGVMTQKQACDQSPGQCPALDNTPAMGWDQLYDAINSNSNTRGGLPWLTDIKWWDGKPPLVGNNILTNSQAASTPGPSLYQQIASQLTAQLSSPQLTLENRQLLEEKLQIANRILQNQQIGLTKPAAKDLNLLNAAPRASDPPFLSGIFDGPGGVFSATEGDFQNHWQGQDQSSFVFVSAGNVVGSPADGLVVIVRISADRLNLTRQGVKAPSGSGALQVEGGNWPLFQLISASGQHFQLDASIPVIQPAK